MVFGDIDVLQGLVGHRVHRGTHIHLLQRVSIKNDEFVGQQFQVEQNQAALEFQALQMRQGITL